nr:TPM domain-containing protein [Mycobacterium leprae]
MAPSAGAQPPFQLPEYVTDNAGTLSESGHTAITLSIDKLYEDRQVRLEVVYVDDFAGTERSNLGAAHHAR